MKMDAAKSNNKKKIRRKVVNIHCRKLSSNRSYLSVSRSAGYKNRIKTLSKNNKDLASALASTKCDLENCKQSLNRLKYAQIKMLEMYKNLKLFMKDFEEALVLFNSDDGNWLTPASVIRLRSTIKNPFESVEEITETESMMEKQLDIEELDTNHIEISESAITDEPKNLTLPDELSETFRPINLQLKDNAETLQSPSMATEKENRDSATPKLSLPSPIINNVIPKACLKDNSVLSFENNSDIVANSSIKTSKKIVKFSKIPRTRGLYKSKMSSGKNNFDKVLSLNTDNANKVCEFAGNHEISCSKSCNIDQYQKAIITNHDNVKKDQSDASQQITYKISEKLYPSSMLSTNCDVLREVYMKDIANISHDQELKEVCMMDSANTLQIPMEKSARRNTFVIKKKGNIFDSQTDDYIDRRKTFVKKSSEINIKGDFVASKPHIFISHQSPKDNVKCADPNKGNVDITSKSENMQLQELNVNARFVETCQKVDNAFKTAVNMDPGYAEKLKDTESEMNFDICNNTFLTECSPPELKNSIENTLNVSKKSISEELKMKHKTENVKYHGNEIFPIEMSLHACENIFTTENTHLELGKGIENSFKYARKSLDKELMTTNNIEDIQNGNLNNDILKTANSVKILGKEPNEVEINHENDLQVKIDNVSCRISKNSIKNNELGNNIVDKTIPQNEVQVNETITFQRKSNNVKKKGSNSVDMQVFDDSKIEDACKYKNNEQIYPEFLLSSLESESESFSHIDDINVTSPMKSTPIRKQCSYSKNKKFVFCTNKRKSVMKNDRKSKISNIHENSNDLHLEKFDNFSEKYLNSNTNPTRNSKKRRKTVTFSNNTDDDDNIMDIGPNKNKSKKSNKLLQEIQIPVIMEENSNRINHLNENIKEKNILKLNTSNNSTEETNSLLQGKNKELNHNNIENIVCIDDTKISEININKINKVLSPRKERKSMRRKGCGEKSNSNFDPNHKKNTKHIIKTKELCKDVIVSDNENIKNADVNSMCIDTLSKNKTKKEALNKVKKNSIPKNIFHVSAEIHPPPYSLQLSEVALKGKEKPAKTHKRLSVVLNDVFDSENIDIINISGDRDAFLKDKTTFFLKTSLSDNQDNIRSPVDDNPKNKKSTNNDLLDVKCHRRRKPVNYKEPTLNKKLRR